MLEQIVEENIYYHFPEYCNLMNSAGLDKSKLAEVANQAVNATMDDEDCDMIRDIVNFIHDDLND